MNSNQWPSWHAWCGRLPEAAEEVSSRFAVHAFRRNELTANLTPHVMERHAIHGFRDWETLRLIGTTLETALDQFLRQGWSRPQGDWRGRHPVYVFDVEDSDDGYAPGSPCMDEIAYKDDEGRIERIIPTMSLPSRSRLPTVTAESDWITASAVHELSHLMRAAQLPYRKLQDGKADTVNLMCARTWLWLDEGLSIAAEAELLPANPSWLSYARDWVDRPDRSLHDPRMKYQAAFFARCISRRTDPRFLVDVWKKSRFVWNPRENPRGQSRLSALTALRESLADRGVVLSSATENDLFASGFCFDSFFTDWPTSQAYEPLVHARYGQRALTRIQRLVKGRELTHEGPRPYQLPPLACRYFQFIPTDGAGTLEVASRVKSGRHLKMEVVFVAKDTGFPILETRRVAERVMSEGGQFLVAAIPEFSADRCAYAIAVVTNCDLDSAERQMLYLNQRPEIAEFLLDVRWT